MPLHPARGLLAHAARNRYALGAFVCMNLEMVNATLLAAERADAPVLVRVHPKIRSVTALATLAAAVRERAGRSRVPVALSLDHGQHQADIADAIAAGFDHVMIDGGGLPLGENIRLTEEVTRFAAPLGVLVEGAIGHMPHGQVQSAAELADPDEARELVQATGLGLLAAAVGNVHGTAHGETKTEARLNLDLIARLRETAGVPLCLHGGSSIPPDAAHAAIEAGVNVFIIFTDVVTAFNHELKRVLLQQPDGFDIVHALEPAQEAAANVIEAKLRLLGSAGQAREALYGPLA